MRLSGLMIAMILAIGFVPFPTANAQGPAGQPRTDDLAIDYVLLAHPDDEASSAQQWLERGDQYTVVVYLTDGGNSVACDGGNRSRLESPPELPPEHGWDEGCVRSRQKSTLSALGALSTIAPADFDDRDALMARGEQTVATEAGDAIVYAGTRDAVVFLPFEDGELQVEDVLAGLRAVRALRGTVLPARPEQLVLDGAFSNGPRNEDDPTAGPWPYSDCSRSQHNDHEAIRNALISTDIGLVRRGTTCATDPDAVMTESVDDEPWELLFDLENGTYRLHYGWLTQDGWLSAVTQAEAGRTERPPLGPPYTSVFTQEQSFWERSTDPEAGANALDGDPTTTEVITTETPLVAAIQVSQGRFGDGGAQSVVLSRTDVFADSLAGSVLLDRAPLLFTPSSGLDPDVGREIGRVLPEGGTVYLLGGDLALSTTVEETLRDDGYRISRLWGDSRVETAVAIADVAVEQFGSRPRPMVARADEWADSIAGGAVAASQHSPILLTPSDFLHPATDAWLRANAATETIVLGGEDAISDDVASGIAGAERISGPERTATAAAITEDLLGVDPKRPRGIIAFHGERTDGWAWGLLASGAAADTGAGLVMVRDRGIAEATLSLVTGCDHVDLLVAGGDAVIPETVREALDEADRNC